MSLSAIFLRAHVFCIHVQTLFWIFDPPPFINGSIRRFSWFGHVHIYIGACQKYGFSMGSPFVKMLDPSYDFHDFGFFVWCLYFWHASVFFDVILLSWQSTFALNLCGVLICMLVFDMPLYEKCIDVMLTCKWMAEHSSTQKKTFFIIIVHCNEKCAKKLPKVWAHHFGM